MLVRSLYSYLAYRMLPSLRLGTVARSDMAGWSKVDLGRYGFTSFNADGRRV